MKEHNIIYSSRRYALAILALLVSAVASAQSLYEMVPVPFNTGYADEVATATVESSLFFCSNRNQNIILSRTDQDDEHLFKWYSVEQKDNQWGSPSLLQKDFIVNAHQGPGTISSDGRQIYLTVNNKDGDGIFTVNKNGRGWGAPRAFAYNRASYKTVHPSFSKDGKRLFFASDMPGGVGGFDIWYCERVNSGWGQPKNAGTEINTAGNELYPFIRSDGTLFFASNGHETMGGFDIFSANEIKGKWLIVNHLSEPFNSASDDFAYVNGNDFSKGYISSNRNGKTVDIFEFKSLAPTFSGCQSQEDNSYTYMFDYQASANDTTSSFTYRWEISDGSVETGDTIYHTFPSVGHYVVTLYVKDLVTGVETKEAEYDVDVADIEQPYITVPEIVKVGVPVKLDAGKSNLPSVAIEGYYWTISDGTQLQGITTENIVFATPREYVIQLGIVGKDKQSGERVELCVNKTIEVTE